MCSRTLRTYVRGWVNACAGGRARRPSQPGGRAVAGGADEGDVVDTAAAPCRGRGTHAGDTGGDNPVLAESDALIAL